MAAALLPHTGRIEAIIGPMYSEKTSDLISRIRRAAYADQAGVIIKCKRDTRYEAGEVIAAHSELRQRSSPGGPAMAPIRVVVAERLSDVLVTEPVVGVDEGQFFPDLIEQCELWAAQGRRVIFAALDASFAREPFGDVCVFLARCESVVKNHGTCMMCRGRDSAFTKRLGPSKELIEIGGRESYIAVCRPCYFAPAQ